MTLSDVLECVRRRAAENHTYDSYSIVWLLIGNRLSASSDAMMLFAGQLKLLMNKGDCPIG
jgi:hypothetical protein